MIKLMNLLCKTFLLSVFLLTTGCSLVEYDRQIEHAIVDNGDYLCEYIKGVKINCYKKSESEVKWDDIENARWVWEKLSNVIVIL